jgi:hypothetical protein
LLIHTGLIHVAFGHGCGCWWVLAKGGGTEPREIG